MRTLFFFLLLSGLFWQASVQARLSEGGRIEFDSTRNVRSHQVFRIPSHCEPGLLNRTYSSMHARQMGSCGAIEKIYEEGIRVTFEVFSANISASVSPVSTDNRIAPDDCRTAERLRTGQSALDALNRVDARVREEVKRVGDICEEELRDMRNFRASMQQACQGTLLQRNEDNYSEVQKDLDRERRERNQARSQYESDLRQKRESVQRSLAEARSCGGGLKSMVPQRR